MNQYIGYLIRKMRLKQNLSQEGLCKGICVVSYLSKIEQGTAQPAEEIIKQLFERLGVTYITDAEEIKRLRKVLIHYFDAFFHREDTKQFEKVIDTEKNKYESSELNLSFQLFDLYRNYFERPDIVQEINQEALKKDADKLGQYVQYMSKNQLFLYGYFMGQNGQASFEERMHWLGVAQQQIPNSMVLVQQGHACFKIGKYMDSVRYLEQAYQMAAEEGNPNSLLESSYLLATCYTNHDQENMMRYYRRTIELARNYQPELMHSIYYNIGASCVEHGQYEEAIENLEKVEKMLKESEQGKKDSEKSRNNIDWLLLYHKLSFSHLQLGHAKKCKEYLMLAKEHIEEYSNATVIKMLRLIEMRLQQDYMQNPEYESLLKEVYDVAGEELGYGFRNYHGKFLVELYKKKRRYKEALEITEELGQTNSHNV